MALVVGNGGLTTQPGSAAAAEGLDLEIVFIEDAPQQEQGAAGRAKVDFVWQTVDELPISLGGFKAAERRRARVPADRLVARRRRLRRVSKEVKKVEDVLGRKAAMLMFSPDHTVFEFMITNSRLTPDQVAQAAQGDQLLAGRLHLRAHAVRQGKVDVACLWEPDVTLALAGRPGAHRLFSTADATELVADVLLARQRVAGPHPETGREAGAGLVRGRGEGRGRSPGGRAAHRQHVPALPRRARLRRRRCRRFDWVKWTTLGDNVRFFGLDGRPPAFDRVYNQADGIWINYPQAEIKDRFAPGHAARRRHRAAHLGGGGQAGGDRAPETYEPQIAASGKPLFTKPVTISFRHGKSELDAESMAALNQQLMPQLEMARGMYVRVEGNTDNFGDDAANQALSERRAPGDRRLSGQPRRRRPRGIVARGNGVEQPDRPATRPPDGRAAQPPHRHPVHPRGDLTSGRRDHQLTPAWRQAESQGPSIE